MIVLVALALGAPCVARAQAPLGWTGDGTSALPAIRRVGVPSSAPEAVSVSAEAGYALTEPVAWDDGEHHRAFGSLAASVRPLPWLAFWLRADGRYDVHSADEQGVDDGLAGLPRLGARLGGTLDPAVALGLELELLAPGTDAPSFTADGLSMEARFLAAFRPVPALTIGTMVGFRLDNSAATVPRPVPFRRGDHVALGASDYHAVLVGVGVLGAVDPVELFAEVTLDALIPGPLPEGVLDGGPEFPHAVRGSVGGRLHLTRNVGLEVGADFLFTPDRPEVTPYKALVPVEPRVTVYAALRFTFPWSDPAPAEPTDEPTEEATEPPVEQEPTAELATVTGHVTDDRGSPLVGARVTLTREGEPLAVESDADGAFRMTDVPLGPATLRIEASGHEPVEREVEITEGEQALERASLEPSVPRGQLRGMIRSYDGRPLVAQVRVEGIERSAETDAEGFFELDIPPGEHVVVIEAPGHRGQRRTVEVPENGVTVLNADLRRGRSR